MQQHHNHESNLLKRLFNIVYAVLIVYQRAIIVPMRTHYGREFFWPCVFSLLLMCCWVAVSHDEYMRIWIGFWLLAVFARLVQTHRLLARGERIHSRFAGIPTEALKYSSTERTAKQYAEPILVGLLGAAMLLFYKAVELPSLGLPYFFLLGAPVLFFAEGINHNIWDRQLQEMQNARIEQAGMVQESRNRYGE